MSAPSKAQILAQTRACFEDNWKPKDMTWEFTVSLDQLIYAAIAVGQEPFARELDLYRNLVQTLGKDPVA